MEIRISFILACTLSAIICLVVPIALLVGVRLKTHRGLLAGLTGAVCFIVSALVLEQLVHSVVFSAFPLLPQNTVLYTAYGCLMAGLFEETARYAGLRFLCRKDASLVTGIAYGIGHGGAEAILLAGLPCLSSLFVLIVARAGALEAIFGAELTAAIEAQLFSQGLSPLLLLVPGLERLAAMGLHVALSLLVWMAVTRRLPAAALFGAMLLHAFANVGAALYQCGVFSLLAAEVWTYACVLAIGALVWRFYRKTQSHIAASAGNE